MIKMKQIVNISNDYKLASMDDRIEFISALIDYIGFSDHNKHIKIKHTFKNNYLVNDIIFICRSIGLNCKKVKSKFNWLFSQVSQFDRWNIELRGSMLDSLKTSKKIKTKYSSNEINGTTLSKIDIVSVGFDNYYGFTLDCNNRYLLNDCTVTHNTVTSIVLALEQTKITNRPIIVVVSKTLISNWISEIKKFFGDELKYAVLHKDFIKNLNNFELNDTKLIITTPAVTSKYYKEEGINDKFINLLNERVVVNGNLVPRRVKEYMIPMVPQGINGNIIYKTEWGCLIIDEIQEHCNIESATCCSIASICSNYKWGLSGTLFNEPKLERIMGYFVMINELNFPRRIDYAEKYIKSSRFTGYMPTVVYRKGINNFVKPNINKIIVQHSLNVNEVNIYVSLKECLKIITRYIANLTRNNGDERSRYSSYLLALITYLRQMIVCPLLPITNCMLDSIDLNNESELSTLILHEFEKLNLYDYLNDVNSIYSSRIQKINEVVNSIQHKKIIIFTCFKTNLDIIMSCVDQTREKYTISATMSISARGQEIENFKNSVNSILFLTYQLGSEGLNLQFCDTILFADMYWNMGKINQAEARVIRPGQLAKNVDLYYFISNTAIEKGILEKHNDKLVVIDEIKTGSMKTQIRTLKTADIIKILNDENNKNIYQSNLQFNSKK